MRRILVAIDGSDGSMRALDFAARQAGYAPAAELHVLTIQPAAAANTAWEIYVSAERLQEIAAERSRDILASASERLKGANFAVYLEQRTGEPAETIANRAAELGCESIVMGTHGLGKLGVLLMGSVAQRVLHYATLPVTLVK
jgi:nucleotide-binding universal stress UspA family protein